jgi:hypothetical protein
MKKSSLYKLAVLCAWIALIASIILLIMKFIDGGNKTIGLVLLALCTFWLNKLSKKPEA